RNRSSGPPDDEHDIDYGSLLERVFDRLAELAVDSDDGITWFTPPELLPEWQRELAPGGYYNLGGAHGLPGVIALLGAACGAGAAGHRERRLLEGAVQWMLAHELPAGGRGRFPSWVGPGVDRHPARLAWCYGDLGIAAALWCAARGA